MRVLHAGCGNAELPEWVPATEEVRLDIDEEKNPDVVASLTEMGPIGDFDAVYSAHCLEHLYPHEVPKALGEFHRILKDGGVAIVIVPDLEGLEPTDDIVFEAPCGPVPASALFYGFAPYVARNPYMAHHTGFVEKTLKSALQKAGFSRVETKRVWCHNLFAAAVKGNRNGHLSDQ